MTSWPSTRPARRRFFRRSDRSAKLTYQRVPD
jgi:hypothetical protein